MKIAHACCSLSINICIYLDRHSDTLGCLVFSTVLTKNRGQRLRLRLTDLLLPRLEAQCALIPAGFETPKLFFLLLFLVMVFKRHPVFRMKLTCWRMVRGITVVITSSRCKISDTHSKKKVTAKPRGRSCSSGRCPTFGVCSEGRRLHIFLSCCWQILQYFSGPHGSRPHVKAKGETTVWGPLSPKHMKGAVLFMPLGLSSAFCLGSLILSPLMPPPRGKQVGRGPALMKPHTSNQQRNLSVMATCGWPPRLCDCYRGGDFLFVAHASSPLQFFLTQLPSPSISILPSGAMWPECAKLKVFIVDFCKRMVF